MKTNFKLVICLCMLVSCKKCKEEDTNKLCTTAAPLTNGTLRLNGYYYNNYNSSDLNIVFLYGNGVLLYGGSISNNQLADFEGRFANGQYYSNNKDNAMVWGHFKINQNHFVFERLYPSTSNLIPYIREGELLNDSTFHISKVYRCDGSELTTEDATYHFKAFSPKPDSTNQFVP